MSEQKKQSTGEKQGKVGHNPNKPIGFGNPPQSPETTFQPGESGNLAGRPPGRSLKEIIKDILEDIPNKSIDEELEKKFGRKLTRNERITLKQAKKADEDGDTRAATALWDRLDGKPKESVELGGSVDMRVTMKLKTDKDVNI